MISTKTNTIIAITLCLLIRSARLNSFNAKTSAATPIANQAARLIEAGSTIIHNAQEMDDNISKAFL